MTKLLFDKQPILMDRTLARLIGFNESIVVQQVHCWIKINENKKQNFIENRQDKA